MAIWTKIRSTGKTTKATRLQTSLRCTSTKRNLRGRPCATCASKTRIAATGTSSTWAATPAAASAPSQGPQSPFWSKPVHGCNIKPNIGNNWLFGERHGWTSHFPPQRRPQFYPHSFLWLWLTVKAFGMSFVFLFFSELLRYTFTVLEKMAIFRWLNLVTTLVITNERQVKERTRQLRYVLWKSKRKFRLWCLLNLEEFGYLDVFEIECEFTTPATLFVPAECRNFSFTWV